MYIISESDVELRVGREKSYHVFKDKGESVCGVNNIMQCHYICVPQIFQ